MTAPQKSGSRGKWIAAAIVMLALVAAVAEWKFRPSSDAIPAATMPATQP